MTIYLGADHGGFHLKEKLMAFLRAKGYCGIHDLGNHGFDSSDDYPDFARAVACKTVESEDNKGIVICTNGQGVCMTANKIRGVRAGIRLF